MCMQSTETAYGHIHCLLINRHCIYSHIHCILINKQRAYSQQALHIQSQALPINQEVIFIQSTDTVYSHKHCILINRHCIYSHMHCLLINNQYLYSHRHAMTMCDSWYIITSQLLRCYYISGITHCHSCSWYTRIVQVIILFFLFIFSNSRDILKWTVRCCWRNGWRYSYSTHHCDHLRDSTLSEKER